MKVIKQDKPLRYYASICKTFTPWTSICNAAHWQIREKSVNFKKNCF